jgi:hypothetical protein
LASSIHDKAAQLQLPVMGGHYELVTFITLVTLKVEVLYRPHSLFTPLPLVLGLAAYLYHVILKYWEPADSQLANWFHHTLVLLL